MEYEIGPDESVSVAVVKAADQYPEADPAETENLFDVVDPDALDTLFVPRGNDAPRTGGRVSFMYRGCHVTVSHGEFLTIKRANPSETQAPRFNR